MIPLLSLWLPIVVSAILVFVASAITHMLLPHHRNDVVAVPAEDAVMDALRPFSIPPGNYVMPYGAGSAAMQDPAFIEKRTRGPVALLTILPSGQTGMGKQLGLWFVYTLIVSLFAGYIASRALAPGAAYAAVFQFAGATAFVAYGLGGWAEPIWWGRKWTTTLKDTLDGLIYALVTGGVFGFLWPG